MIVCDERGLWIISDSGTHGIEWGEIVAVSGHKLDGITEIYTVVALDFEYGEFVEIDDTMPGFPNAIDAITSNVPDIDPEWFEQIKRLSEDHDPIEVWKRG